MPVDYHRFRYLRLLSDKLLEENAADGAVLVELRFGASGHALKRPNFMYLFRQAEQRVQIRYPLLFAEAVVHLPLDDNPAHLRIAERQLEICLELAQEGLAGIDFSTTPYSQEADPSLWDVIYRWADRVTEAGLRTTVHAGEFSVANLAAALRIPNLTRIGHAVFAGTDSWLLESLNKNDIIVECCLSSNVILGAVPTYEEHPIRKFVSAGVPVTLNTDDPVRIWTTIGREYAIASELGFSDSELLSFTRNAILGAFTTEERRKVLLDELNLW